MFDDYGFEEFERNEFPLAYLITIRTYGTWLHGDPRGSVDVHGENVYGTPLKERNAILEDRMRSKAKDPPVELDERQRRAVDLAIRELCDERGYLLRALNVRTNHVHSVISAQMRPERIADAMKAKATKKLRVDGLVPDGKKIWSRGRSRRWLWKPRDVEAAIRYTLYCQDRRSFDQWLADNGYGPIRSDSGDRDD